MKRIEFTFSGEIPDTDAELAHTAIHQTGVDRKALVANMEALGMTGVTMSSRIVPQRKAKAAA
jgi:hypothetical protein